MFNINEIYKEDSTRNLGDCLKDFIKSILIK